MSPGRAVEEHGRHEDRLIHGYFDTNPAIVWETVRRDLPAIEPPISRALEEEIGGEDG